MKLTRVLLNVVLWAFLLSTSVFACGTVDLPRSEIATATATQTPVVEIPNWKSISSGVLTGGQPTPEQIEEAASLEFIAIVNTRGTDEPGFEWEAELVEKLGMRYVHIPVSSLDDLDRKNVESLSETLAIHDDAPVMVHCKSGNRVGALFALRAAWTEGADIDEAIQIGRDSGLTRLESATRAILEP